MPMRWLKVPVYLCGAQGPSKEVWWMGGGLHVFQGTGRCGVWMVNDLCLLGWFLCL